MNGRHERDAALVNQHRALLQVHVIGLVDHIRRQAVAGIDRIDRVAHAAALGCDHDRVGRNVLQCDHLFGKQRMIRRHHDAARVAQDRDRLDHARFLLRDWRQCDGKIRSAGIEFFQNVAARGKRLGEYALRKARHKRAVERAEIARVVIQQARCKLRLILHGQHVPDQRIGPRDDVLRAPVEKLPVGIEHDAALLNVKQLRAQLLLQTADDLGHKRLRHAERLRRLCDAAQLRRQAKITQILQLHRTPPSLHPIIGAGADRCQ